MRVARLKITNYKGIKSSDLFFDGHTLLIGMNNVGKSTVCEALELVLGLDRLKRFPPVEEFDFHNSEYLDRTAEPPVPNPIEIEVVMTHLSEELAKKCFDRLERWHLAEKRVLGEGEAALVDDEAVTECLRIKALASYNQDEDEFEAKSVFCGGPVHADGSAYEVPRHIRQLFGFFYLRALRTGSRALSLERGSLLDVILQRQNIRTGIWENAIQQLRDLAPPIDAGAIDLEPVLDNIEKRLARYIPLNTGGSRATQLFVSQLRREHLRKTISFFLRTAEDQTPVPFEEAGTGTLNTLVLALLSFIAELKKDNVVFAMEEPEIALPPHTQRRIAAYLLEKSTQCFVTSHSPYVIERFEPEQIQILRRSNEAVVTGTALVVGATLKGKTYRKHARRGLSEAMLGRAAIVCEGITEKDIVLAVAAKLEDSGSDNYYPLDLSGVTAISVDGDGALAEFGAFFKALEIESFAFYDNKARSTTEQEKLAESFDHLFETPYKGSEDMLTAEVPTERLWDFLKLLRDSGEKPNLPLSATMHSAEDVKKLASSILQKDKGSGYAGKLIELCAVNELPVTVVKFLEDVYGRYPKPDPIPPIPEPTPKPAAAAAAAQAGGAVAPSPENPDKGE